MNKVEHLLVCLAEECAEIQQAVSKALRFGLDDGAPGGEITNAQDIAKECCDIVALIDLLEEEGVIYNSGTIQAIEQKKAKVKRYMEYAKMRGTLHSS